MRRLLSWLRSSAERELRARLDLAHERNADLLAQVVALRLSVMCAREEADRWRRIYDVTQLDVPKVKNDDPN